MQNVVVLINSIEEAYDISIKAVNMYLNRLCIDEEAAFESTGVHFLKKIRTNNYGRGCGGLLKINQKI